ncbi:hypothetical protein THRCLA_09072 [Thraustotheca clavata]|uniref:Uncharacterized protein n=1 Tax=Thraustotheca clavata TaxID=74557 RepID=A0A1V9Z096_9STRA|nr:hypothetical protein THRCLA_09072 [Thraustotheca clavata]
MSEQPTCYFHGCNNKPMEGTVKCHFHRNRGLCRIPNCHNQVYARNLCVRHGGRHPCAFPGCSTNARLGQFCCKHSKLKKLCQYPNCTNLIQINNLCIRHGGSKCCKYEGCSTPARTGGYCWRHRKYIAKRHATNDVAKNVHGGKPEAHNAMLHTMMLAEKDLELILPQDSNFLLDAGSNPQDLDDSILEVLLKCDNMTISSPESLFSVV